MLRVEGAEVASFRGAPSARWALHGHPTALVVEIGDGRAVCSQNLLSKNRVLKKSKNEVGFEPGACRVFFRAGLSGRAGRRPVGPVKIGGLPGPERLLLRTRHRVQYRFLEASGVSAPKNCNNFFFVIFLFLK